MLCIICCILHFRHYIPYSIYYEVGFPSQLLRPRSDDSGIRREAARGLGKLGPAGGSFGFRLSKGSQFTVEGIAVNAGFSYRAFHERMRALVSAHAIFVTSYIASMTAPCMTTK